MMRPLLILACSGRKHPAPAPVPAADLYDGVLWRVLNRWRRDNPDRAAALRLLVLSAEHGLIAGDLRIATYDRRMNARRAVALRPAVAQAAQQLRGAQRPTRAAVVAGAHYRAALEDVWGLLDGVPLAMPMGGIGSKMAALKGWLEGLP